MDATRFRRARELYERAEALAPERRAEFLELHCSADPHLRRDVELLLGATPCTEFLEPPRTIDASVAAALPERIGRYRILHVLGSGGMGVVYAAEQDEPRRRVALKVLRVTVADEVTAKRFRFEAELLGRLDHPGIARIFEAGMHHEPGVGDAPYIAIEWVDGARNLLDHARTQSLDARARVSLLRKVVEAVQAGHQQGIVHRDLKPENVIVGSNGEPKVIDFGVARWLHEEANMQTVTGALIGTPAYMAPEQFEGGATRADTRTDVHALGLIAHELFYGSRPYEIEGKSLTAIARTIREQPLHPPARGRQAGPRELWWIVARALEKEPDRRYPSAVEFAADLTRFLRGEPVEAGPPGTWYRARKLVQRHRVLFGIGTFAALVLAVGGSVALIGLLRAHEENARFKAIHRLFEDVLAGARDDALGPSASARALVDRAVRRLDARPSLPLDVEAPIRATLARAYLDLGADDAACIQARRSHELLREIAALGDPQRMNAAYLLGCASMRLGELAAARAAVEETRPACASLDLDEAHRIIVSLGILDAEIHLAAGDHEKALEAALTIVARSRRDLGPTHDETIAAEQLLPEMYRSASRPHEALVIAERAAEATSARFGPRSPPAVAARLDVVQSRQYLDRESVAEAELRQLLDDANDVFGPDHPDTLTIRMTLANEVLLADRPGDAAAILEEVTEIRRSRYGYDVEALLDVETLLARSWAEAGDPRGEPLMRKVVERWEERVGPIHPKPLSGRFRLGRLLRQTARFDEAESELRAVFDGRRELLGPEHIDTMEAELELAMLATSRGTFEEADRRWQSARASLERALGPSHELRARAAWNHGRALHELGRHDEAVELMEGALSTFRETLAGREASLLWSVQGLAMVNAYAGRLDRFEELAAEVRGIVERHPELESARTFDMFSLHAQTLVRAQRHTSALAILERLVLRPAEAETARRGLHAVNVRGLGACLHALGRPQEALESWFESLRLDATRLGFAHEAVTELLRDIRSLGEELGVGAATEARIAALEAELSSARRSDSK